LTGGHQPIGSKNRAEPSVAGTVVAKVNAKAVGQTCIEPVGAVEECHYANRHKGIRN